MTMTDVFWIEFSVDNHTAITKKQKLREQPLCESLSCHPGLDVLSIPNERPSNIIPVIQFVPVIAAAVFMEAGGVD